MLLRQYGMKNVDCVLPDHLDHLWQQMVPAGGRHLVVRSGVRIVGDMKGGEVNEWRR